MEIKSKEDLISLLTSQQEELSSLKTQLEAMSQPDTEGSEEGTEEDSGEGDGEATEEEVDEIEAMLSDI